MSNGITHIMLKRNDNFKFKIFITHDVYTII